MSISYQDIDQRLRIIESKVNFIMTSQRVRAIVTTGLLDQQGNPVGQETFNGTLLEFYHLTNQLDLINSGALVPPPTDTPAPIDAEFKEVV